MSKPLEIQNIDLSEGTPNLQQANSDTDLFVIFWWRNIPLGNTTLAASMLPLTGEQIVDHALKSITPAMNAYWDQKEDQTLEFSASTVDRPNPSARQWNEFRFAEILVPVTRSLEAHTGTASRTDTVSIIIPTRDRPSELEACLKSVMMLRGQPKDIIVVDNAPGLPATQRLIERFPNIRYVPEPRPGASVARNTGVAQTEANIIAFIDDDETVHPDWLLWHLQCHQDRSFAVSTGLVLPRKLETKAQLLFESRFSFIRGYAPKTYDTEFFERTKLAGVPVWEIGGSGNMAVQREIFLKLGGFDERLGAGRAGGNEDMEFFYRVLAAGWKCHYEPKAICYHAHRFDMEALKQQVNAYMRGHVAALLVQYAKHGHRGNLKRLFSALPRDYLGACWHCLTRRSGFPPRLLMAELHGCLSGIWYYLRNRNQPSRIPEEEKNRPSGSQSVEV